MTYRHSPVLRFIGLFAIAASLMLASVHADEFADVSQLARAGKVADALSKAEQYLTTKPRDPQMRLIKGVLQRESGKTAEALETFTRLAEDYPELPETYNNLAVLHAGQNQYEKARTALEMAVRTNPDYAIAQENLGDVYAKLASQAYAKAAQLDTSSQTLGPKLAVLRELFNMPAKKRKTPRSPAAAGTADTPAPPPPQKP